MSNAHIKYIKLCSFNNPTSSLQWFSTTSLGGDVDVDVEAEVDTADDDGLGVVVVVVVDDDNDVLVAVVDDNDVLVDVDDDDDDDDDGFVVVDDDDVGFVVGIAAGVVGGCDKLPHRVRNDTSLCLAVCLNQSGRPPDTELDLCNERFT